MSWGVLRRYSRKGQPGRSTGLPGKGPAGRCELCAAPLGEPHRHVLELAGRGLRCACPACALLFVEPAAAAGRYRTVPDRVLVDPARRWTAEEMAELGIPVRLAYLVRGVAAPGDTATWTAFYPSPAGPTEAQLTAGAAALLEVSTLGRLLQPDVEALLVHRAHPAAPSGVEPTSSASSGPRVEVLLVPITACLELVAQVRAHWRGFDGGDDARRLIDESLVRLRQQARHAAVPAGGMPAETTSIIHPPGGP